MSEKEFYGRTLARSQALQLLFQAEATGRSVEDVLAGSYALSQGPLDEYARELAVGADSQRRLLDDIIASASQNWALGRMPAVDRNLLRVALYEMLYEEDVAAAVTIDEAVELAKAYGTDESGKFVNGLLGRVAADVEGGKDVLAEAQEHVDAGAGAHDKAAGSAGGDGYEPYLPDAPDYYTEDDAREDDADRDNWYGFDDDPAYRYGDLEPEYDDYGDDE